MSAKQIFLTAVENYDPKQWDDYLDETCGDDRTLRDRVADLLTAHRQSNPLLDDAGVFSLNASDQLIERPGMLIGQFRILEEIGEGGFGVIFLCEQTEPIRRRVAVKVLKPGLDSRQVVARFEAERQALAMMEHPNIASVMEAGLAPSGRPYFAMELVQGIPITQYLDEHRLSVPERLTLFLDVCSAVQHAHLKGIIHRDLKPSNILVASAEGKPIVKVIDFGIAKATGSQQLTDKTLHSCLLGFMGTPTHMSPEQISLGEHDIDIRCDIYGLGILLYEILTSKTPLDSKKLLSLSYDEIRRRILDCEPNRPSATVSGFALDELAVAASNRQLESERLRLCLKGELDWITLKAIDKDRSRRYQSAREMADDIQCYLSDTPVRACPPSHLYLLGKFIRRNQIALVTSGLVGMALVVGTFVSLWQANEARRAMRLADQSLEREQSALKEVLESESHLQHQLYATQIADAWNALNDGDRVRTRVLLNKNQPAPGRPDLREFSWKFTNSLLGNLPREFVGHEAEILTASISPDNRLIVSGDKAGNIKVWGVDTGQEVASWKYSSKEIQAAVFSPNGKTLATAGQDATLRLWNTDNWQEVATLRGHSASISSISWSSDGLRLASGARDKTVRIWDVVNGLETHCLQGRNDVFRVVKWDSISSQLVVADGNEIRSWNTENWEPSFDHKDGKFNILSLALSQCGQWMASAGYDNEVLLYDRFTNKLLTRVETGSTVWSLAFSPDGKYLLAGLGDGGPMIWRIGSNGKTLESVRGGLVRDSIVRAIEFTSDQSQLIVATQQDKKFRLWNSKSVFGNNYISFPEDCLDVDPRSGLAINGKPDGTIVVRSFPSGTMLGEMVGHSRPVSLTATSTAMQRLATFAGGNEVFVWDLKTSKLLYRLTIVNNPGTKEPLINQLEFSPDDRFLAVAGVLTMGSVSNSVRLWNVADGTLYRDVCFDPPGGAHFGFSPDGQEIAIGTSEKVSIFPIASSSEPTESFRTSGHVFQLRFSPNGKQLVTSGGNDGATVWDSRSKQKLFQFARQRILVRRLAISPDGQTLATIGVDNALRLWHLPSERELCMLLHHAHPIKWLKFASNTKLMAGAPLDGNSAQGVFVFDASE